MKKQHIITFLCVLVILFFIGCLEEPAKEDAFTVSSVTISNIPKTIPAFIGGTPAADTYKVYLYVTDYMTNQDRPKAKAVTRIDDTAKVKLETNGTYTVIMELGNIHPNFKEGRPGHNPNLEEYDPNPNRWYGSWSGTAGLFTLVISPKDTLEHAQLSVWMKAGYDLDVDKKNIDWSPSGGLLNFRSRLPVQDFPDLEWKFYHDNICWDPEIRTHATYLDPPNRCDLDTSKPMDSL
jgi:hypothetical protein